MARDADSARSRSCRRCAAAPSSTCSSRTPPAPASRSRSRPSGCPPTSSTSRPRGPACPRASPCKDTALTLEAMGADAVVVRHHASGAPHRLANSGWINGAVVNAGDGTHEHPTQALLDAFTMRRRLGGRCQGSGPAGRRILIVGDVLHSRVARSNVLLLQHPRRRGHAGWRRRRCCRSASRPGRADVVRPRRRAAQGRRVMMLRVQRERMNASFFPSAREYSRRYGLDGRRIALLPDHAIVMHPGPMNRGLEIAADVADSVRSTIVEQVANGVSVRMAVLYLLLPASNPISRGKWWRHDRPTGDVVKGARVLGGQAGRSAARGRRGSPRSESGLKRPAQPVLDADGLVALPGPGRPAHPPARARSRGRRDRRDRHPRRGARRLHRGARDGQHRPGRRHRGRRRAGLAARPRGRLVDVRAGRRRHRRAGRRAARRARRDGRLGRAGAGLLRRRPLRARRRADAPGAGVRQGLRRRRRPARPGAAARPRTRR